MYYAYRKGLPTKHILQCRIAMMHIKIKNFSFDIACRILCAATIVTLSPMYLSYESGYDLINIAAIAYAVYFLLSESLRLYKMSGKFFLDYDGILIRVYDSAEKKTKEIFLEDVTNVIITKRFVKISTSHDLTYLHFNMMSFQNQSLFLNKIYPEIQRKVEFKKTSSNTAVTASVTASVT
ncbi:hypothetical protein [Endozoicomonas ascidiicola]|uniref:hypothetical protein n=1 Tax=Endozoicomonas ascidiicola TaxID=1698521 RepID=UPI00082A2F73|nr:hypothetical protein [Endozoicomonas ascidiicola]USN26993.1 hypothetical protein [synthetic construct]